ncbi:MAG: beta-hydroxyacyl-ACP dehydratase [Spirochaetia bacterium]|nr:beta-hydroxyacyl-ACP dehydratase [Spirochaetia bacterium]
MEIKDILLHREPFLFVDEILEADEKKIIGSYTYKEDEYFFKGHFPNHPVVPGVLQIELMAQVGGAGLAYAKILEPGQLFVLGSVEKAKFRKEVKPNDKCIVEIENLRVSKIGIKQQGVVKVNGEIVSQASWLCILVKEQ